MTQMLSRPGRTDSEAIAAAQAGAIEQIQDLATEMQGWDVFKLLAAADAAYAAILDMPGTFEIPLSETGTVTCPGCGSAIESLIEVERESEGLNEADVMGDSGTIGMEPAPNFVDHIIWITKCCATPVRLAEGWLMNPAW
jgi:hypothetical protein